MGFYENFVRLCNQEGKTPSKVALEVGISKSIVSRWKKGGGVTYATAQRIADYFGVPVDALLGKNSLIDEAISIAFQATADKKSPQAKKADGLMNTNYSLLNEENKAVIDSLIEKLLKSQSDE